ncbi:hypothetical protein ACFL6K_06440 [Candidatus Latescibacterota bacterium]
MSLFFHYNTIVRSESLVVGFDIFNLKVIDAKGIDMDVKGEAILSLPIFILKNFGQRAYDRWFDALSPEAQGIFCSPIDKNEWFPLGQAISNPTIKICELFYNGSLKGAYDCGRFSAEYGLKGVYKVLVKLSSPEVLVKKAGGILTKYYRPSALSVIEHGKGYGILHLTEFPECDKYIEQRIAGWIARAVEICGVIHVNVAITKSLAKSDPYTEFRITWKTKAL